MTGNLVPEPRVNIRGHVVVKHVRADSGSPERKSKKVPLPPHLGMPKCPALNKTLARMTQGKVKASQFPPDAVVRVEALIQRIATEAPTLRWRVDSEIARALNTTDKKESRTIFNNIAAFGDVIFRDDFNSVDSYVQGLRTDPEFAGMKDFLTNGTPEKREKAQVLIHFASACAGNMGTARGLLHFEVGEGVKPTAVIVKDAEMRRLATEYPDRIDDMVWYIENHGVTDAAHIREIMEHGQQALNGGVL